jgi:hypothetical protein
LPGYDPGVRRRERPSVISATIRSINRTLGANFVTKCGTKRGIIAIGKVAPFGFGLVIGAGGNLFMARSVITTTKVMFDSAEKLNAADDENSN